MGFLWSLQVGAGWVVVGRFVSGLSILNSIPLNIEGGLLGMVSKQWGYPNLNGRRDETY